LYAWADRLRSGSCELSSPSNRLFIFTAIDNLSVNPSQDTVGDGDAKCDTKFFDGFEVDPFLIYLRPACAGRAIKTAPSRTEFD